MTHEIKIDIEKERKEILSAFSSLLRATKHRSKEDTKMIRKAFDIAVDAHKDMRRKSGEPYIYHPIAVARICAEEMELGPTAIACALLHDTVEDTHITLYDIEDHFGVTARRIIDGLTKIPEIFDEHASLQAENFRKMIMTISDDLRVVLIKLADRLHNMRTLDSMKPDKQLKIASETKFLYAPLAHRLGLSSIKSELEDLGMRYTEPEVYLQIDSKLKSTKDARNRFIRKFVQPIKEALQAEGYVFDVKARTKSISSIWRKMSTKNLPFEEVFDLFAIRIILETPIELEKPDCWRIYSLITDFYQPSPDRLRDWISTPRANGYESLHTTVMSPGGKWVEVQIRSQRMDEIAEKGLAAHYRYKEETGEVGEDTKFDRWIAEIRDLLDQPDTNALEFVNDFKLNLFNEEIYVFTPKGDLRVLPKSSTILDFAYDIHTHIGNTCIGAKVNNRLMPFSHVLKNGDQIEIITSDKQQPKEEWLKLVVSARAKQKIKGSIIDAKKSIVDDGRSTLQKRIEKFGIIFNNENILKIAKFYKVPSAMDLYFRIAKAKIDLTKLRELEHQNGIIKGANEVPLGHDKDESTILSKINIKNDVLVVGDDFKDIQYRLSKCCNPIPGDQIFGYVSQNEGIKIHRVNCKSSINLLSKNANRCVKSKWKSEIVEEQIACLRLVGIDDIGIVNAITEIISKQHSVNMKSISFDSNDGVFEGLIKVYVFDREHLEQLIQKFEMVEGVKTVDRCATEKEDNF